MSVLHLHRRILRFFGIVMISSEDFVLFILKMSLVEGRISLKVLSHMPTQLAKPWMLCIVRFVQAPERTMFVKFSFSICTFFAHTCAVCEIRFHSIPNQGKTCCGANLDLSLLIIKPSFSRT